jgi:hypothetical protein
MIRHPGLLARSCPSLLAGLLLVLLPGAGAAQTVVFRNECRVPVVVQTATVVKGVLVKDDPYPLRPTEATPKIALGVNKLLVITDAKSNRILFKELCRATRKELAYGIVPHPRLRGAVTVSPRQPKTVTPGKHRGKMATGRMTSEH